MRTLLSQAFKQPGAALLSAPRGADLLSAPRGATPKRLRSNRGARVGRSDRGLREPGPPSVGTDRPPSREPPRLHPQGQQGAHGIGLYGGRRAGHAREEAQLLTGVSRSVSSLPSELGTGGQEQSAASTLKAFALTRIWAKFKALTETPPDGFEPSTGCLEGSCSIQLS
jgi:hypothetical protein